MGALKMLIWCSSFAAILAENTTVHMSQGGILVIEDPRPLNILTVNIIITLKLDTEIFKETFPKFI